MDMSSGSSGMDHGGMDHGGMDHGGMMGGMDHGSMRRSCKIDMLFNVNTIGSCFFTDKFYIETHGQFAGACILAIILVVALEALRRATREFDRFIVNQHLAHYRSNAAGIAGAKEGSDGGIVPCAPVPSFRPSLVQQLIRAFLHMLQFGTAYIIMLFAMYYNGYIILCIVLGAFIGFIAFNWEPIAALNEANGTKEATSCCG